jgi:MoaA/NifB/PqqE/SkfB family radical SAM enzyme
MILPSYPFRIEFEVNHICNLRCHYCYAQPFTNITPPFQNLAYLFDKTQKEAAPFEVILLGGEPFLRNDILEIIELALKTFNHTVGISTNGTLLSSMGEEKLLKLKEQVTKGLSIQVSIDSADSKVNDATRGLTERTLAGLDVLEKNKIPFSIGLILTNANRNDVLKTEEYALSKYKALRMFNLETLQPTFILGKRWFDMKLELPEMLNIRENAIKLTKDMNREDVKVKGVVEESSCSNGKPPLSESYGFKTCTAGLFRAGVFVDGSVTPCVTIRTLVMGNLFKESWEEIWSKSGERFKHLNFVKNESGRQCNINLLRKETVEVEKIKLR